MMAQWFDVFDKLLSGKDVMDDENDKCVPGVSWCRGLCPRQCVMCGVRPRVMFPGRPLYPKSDITGYINNMQRHRFK